MFTQVFEQYDWEETGESIRRKTASDVLAALARRRRTPEDFKALVSPAAQPFLETMARESHALTSRRFGKTIQMYLPLYLSNECQNICTYCAFSQDNPIPRRTLTDNEIRAEAAAIRAMGYEHVLLVTGEANRMVGVDYLLNAVELLWSWFSNISIEVQPLSEDDYTKLRKAGVHAVLVYQETYREAGYKMYHPKGKKANFRYRLETPDRLGKAGMHRVGLGTLIGLADWRTDAFFTALHLRYLEQTYWRTRYAVSFPRLRSVTAAGTEEGVRHFDSGITDRELVQLITAYRLFSEDLEISLSTREEARLRNRLIPLGITSMSAGSKTNPGGYRVEPQTLEQFEISDERSAGEVAAVIRAMGYEPVWKDWDRAYNA